MANETRPPQQDRLPIKLIMPNRGRSEKSLLAVLRRNLFGALTASIGIIFRIRCRRYGVPSFPRCAAREVLRFVSNCSPKQQPRAIDRNTSSLLNPVRSSARVDWGSFSLRRHPRGLIVWRR